MYQSDLRSPTIFFAAFFQLFFFFWCVQALHLQNLRPCSLLLFYYFCHFHLRFLVAKGLVGWCPFVELFDFTTSIVFVVVFFVFLFAPSFFVDALTCSTNWYAAHIWRCLCVLVYTSTYSYVCLPAFEFLWYFDSYCYIRFLTRFVVI